MRRVALTVAPLVVLIGATVLGLLGTAPKLPDPREPPAHESSQSFTTIERGRYLAKVADCAACHDDPRGGGTLSGGRPIQTPFGMVIAPNITPDQETGIGSWTSAEFANALQHGVSRDGHMLYPAMPYVYYTRMQRDDVDAIFAFVNTVGPVRHKVEPNQLPFPFSVRLGMRVWNALYFLPGAYRADTMKDARWNRGAYLVTGAGHCGACHTPKTSLGGDDSDRFLQGAPVQNWYAPNLTGDEHRGIGSWSQDEIVEYLRSGHNKQAAASGPMGEEVSLSSSGFSQDDLYAMAVFLKSLPGQAAPATVALPEENAQMKAGRAIYDDSCAACHRSSGLGTPGLFPALKSPAVQSDQAINLIRVVLEGAKSISTDRAPTGAAMPPYGWKLEDDQVAAVLTYIRNAWGNRASAVTADDVANFRRRLH